MPEMINIPPNHWFYSTSTKVDWLNEKFIESENMIRTVSSFRIVLNHDFESVNEILKPFLSKHSLELTQDGYIKNIDGCEISDIINIQNDQNISFIDFHDDEYSIEIYRHQGKEDNILMDFIGFNKKLALHDTDGNIIFKFLGYDIKIEVFQLSVI